MAKTLEDLPNIGEKLADRLRKIGIGTPDRLKEIGSVQAVIMMNEILNEGCYSSLYALEGAILGIR